MENHSFEYTYSAQRQKEIEEIRKAYLPQEEDTIDTLRRLHSIPTQKAQAASIAAGIIGTLIFGTGMSLCLTDFGAALGNLSTLLGIIVGICGIAFITMAYPIYHRILKNQRKKIAPEILSLCEKMMQS